jgi:DNA-binding CsgD family transcriptional regulator/uncharacterized protein YciI
MTRFVVEMQFRADSERLAWARPAHLRYWERLADRGFLLGGGLFADESGGLLLCDAPDEPALRRVVDADPYVVHGLVQRLVVRAWNVMVGLPGPASRPAARPVTPEALGLTMASSGPAGSLVKRIDNGARIARPVIPEQTRTLTAHEQRIAGLMLAGKTNREIAAQFSVSARAVELHITSMYRKLGINRRAQLAGALQG